MNQYIKRTQRYYSLSFKLAVVELVEKGDMTSRQAQDRYLKPRTTTGKQSMAVWKPLISKG